MVIKYRRHLSYERSVSDFGTCSGRCKCFLHKYKNKALYFIHTDEEKNAGLSSLMKYDISNKKLDTLKADTNYVYIKDQTLFYPKKYSEHGGFDIVGIVKWI